MRSTFVKSCNDLDEDVIVAHANFQLNWSESLLDFKRRPQVFWIGKDLRLQFDLLLKKFASQIDIWPFCSFRLQIIPSFKRYQFLFANMLMRLKIQIALGFKFSRRNSLWSRDRTLSVHDVVCPIVTAKLISWLMFVKSQKSRIVNIKSDFWRNNELDCWLINLLYDLSRWRRSR